MPSPGRQAPLRALPDLAAAARGRTPSVEDPPEAATAPKACSQRTITVPGDVTPKIRQRLRWGSPEWIRSFNRRTLVEGNFGNLKSPRTENVRRGWTNIVGLVKTSLMVTIAQVAANLRLLRGWAARTGDRTDALTALDPEDHGFEELEPGTGGPGITSPPLATSPPSALSPPARPPATACGLVVFLAFSPSPPPAACSRWRPPGAGPPAAVARAAEGRNPCRNAHRRSGEGVS